jgi:hypothetical protein
MKGRRALRTAGTGAFLNEKQLFLEKSMAMPNLIFHGNFFTGFGDTGTACGTLLS